MIGTRWAHIAQAIKDAHQALAAAQAQERERVNSAAAARDAALRQATTTRDQTAALATKRAEEGFATATSKADANAKLAAERLREIEEVITRTGPVASMPAPAPAGDGRFEPILSGDEVDDVRRAAGAVVAAVSALEAWRTARLRARVILFSVAAAALFILFLMVGLPALTDLAHRWSLASHLTAAQADAEAKRWDAAFASLQPVLDEPALDEATRAAARKVCATVVPPRVDAAVQQSRFFEAALLTWRYADCVPAEVTAAAAEAYAQALHAHRSIVGAPTADERRAAYALLLGATWSRIGHEDDAAARADLQSYDQWAMEAGTSWTLSGEGARAATGPAGPWSVRVEPLSMELWNPNALALRVRYTLTGRQAFPAPCQPVLVVADTRVAGQTAGCHDLTADASLELVHRFYIPKVPASALQVSLQPYPDMDPVEVTRVADRGPIPNTPSPNNPPGPPRGSTGGN